MLVFNAAQLSFSPVGSPPWSAGFTDSKRRPAWWTVGELSAAAAGPCATRFRKSSGAVLCSAARFAAIIICLSAWTVVPRRAKTHTIVARIMAMAR